MDRGKLLHIASSIIKILRQALILACIIFCPALAKTKKLEIITSNSPIAGIVSMIAGNKAQISIMCSSDACPHHYFIKPSQFFKLQNADLIIYVDNSFEVFMDKASKTVPQKVLKLSSIEGIKVVSNNTHSHCPSCASRQNGNCNWHLWLNMDNVIASLESIKNKLSQLDPENSQFYQQQYTQSIAKLQQISAQLKSKIAALPEPIIIFDSSLAYLFELTGNKKTTFLKENSDISKISQTLAANQGKCAFTTSHQHSQDLAKMLNWNGKIVEIEVEKWRENDLENMVEHNMGKISTQLDECAARQP